MNDKELADRVVAHGIKRPAALFGHPQPTNYALVRDWQVAGALMEKCADIRAIAYVDIEGDEAVHADWGVEAINGDANTSDYKYNESLPRAIIEACCEALDG